VWRIRPKDVRNQKVVGALRRRGAARLPALLVAGLPPYVGLREIRGYCEQRLSPPGGGPRGARGPLAPRDARALRPEAAEFRPGPAPGGDEDEDAAQAMEAFYDQEMGGGRRRLLESDRAERSGLDDLSA
jgi:hypothetical protein